MSVKNQVQIKQKVVKKTDDPLKIAIISSTIYPVPPERYGGLEIIVYNLARELAERGHDVTLFAPHGSRTDEKYKVYPTVKPSLDFRLEQAAYETYKSKLSDYQIIHDHTHYHFAYLAKKDNPSLKIIGTWHSQVDVREPPPGILYPNMVAISKHHAEMSSAFVGSHFEVVYNGIDPDWYRYNEKKNNYALFLGRMARFKSPHEAIYIARAANVPLILAGEDVFVRDDSYVMRLRQQCTVDILYLGNVEHSKKRELLSNALALINYVQWHEPFGMVVVEALMSGTPPIAKPLGAMPELIRNGRNGYLVNDTNQAVEAIYKTMDGKISPEKCLLSAKKFTPSVMADGYEKLYRRILKGDEW